MAVIQQKIYVFSGLGVDERVFYAMDFEPFEVVYIQWIVPFEQESISEYALRISAQIDASEPVVLLGLSFGGMMALEVSKHIKISQLILISSAQTKHDLPFYLKAMRPLYMPQLLPNSLVTKHHSLLDLAFGIETQEEQQLLKAILKDTDPVILKWSVEQILNWENEWLPESVVHIHGTNDRLLPHTYLKNVTVLIPNAGHFMVVSHAKELSLLIKKVSLKIK